MQETKQKEIREKWKVFYGDDFSGGMIDKYADWWLNEISTLLAEERGKTINKIKIKVEKHKDKMKDYIWDGDSALEDVLDIINNLDKK